MLVLGISPLSANGATSQQEPDAIMKKSMLGMFLRYVWKKVPNSLKVRKTGTSKAVLFSEGIMYEMKMQLGKYMLGLITGSSDFETDWSKVTLLDDPFKGITGPYRPGKK